MKLKLQTFAAIAIVAIMLATPTSASADAVSDWNAIAVQATVTGARPGPSGIIDIAMVQAAVHDAVQAIERRYQPYRVEIKGASGSPVAAAAKAAHDVLVNRFPAQTASLDTAYNQYLLNNGLALTDPGVAVGATAAAGIIALRACDGSFPVPAPPAFTGGTNPGDWRPTPTGFASMLAPWLGAVTPFTITRPSQFRALPPPPLTSHEYARDYNEVKAMGAINSTDRTPQQTDMAQFWSANYVMLWNQTLREIAGIHVNNIGESSRLFALADMAMADAIITSWNSKLYYAAWRPSTAIQEGNNDGNPQTAGDPTWQPLIVNPPYPDHTSGANNISSAALRSLQLFFGKDRMPFSVTTTNLAPTNQDTRNFNRFSEARQEVVDARIFEGIHFRFADEAARQQGISVANWAFKNFLRPVGEKNDNDENNEDGQPGGPPNSLLPLNE